LFDAVRAGLGQVAVITRATLKLIPAPEHVRRYVLTYPDLRTLLTDERLLAADQRFDAVQGAVLPTPTG
jgi:cytokinin dehydrogenase